MKRLNRYVVLSSAVVLPVLLTGCSFKEVAGGALYAVSHLLAIVLLIVDVIIAAITGANTITAFFSSTRGTNKVTRMGRDSIGNGRQVISFLICFIVTLLFAVAGGALLGGRWWCCLPTAFVTLAALACMFYSNFLNFHRVRDAQSTGRDVAETVQPAVTTVATAGATAIAATAGAGVAATAAIGAAAGVAGASIKRTMDKKLGKPDDTADIDRHAANMLTSTADATKQIAQNRAAKAKATKAPNDTENVNVVADVEARDVTNQKAITENTADASKMLTDEAKVILNKAKIKEQQNDETKVTLNKDEIKEQSVEEAESANTESATEKKEMTDEQFLQKARQLGIIAPEETVDDAVEVVLNLASPNQLSMLPKDYTDKQKAFALIGA